MLPRIVVIADPEDAGALRVVRALQARKDLTCLAVSVDQLLLARRWSHDPMGSTEIVLGNGTCLRNETIAAVFCRIGAVDPPQFARARPADRVYAQEEFYSLLLSWLAQLGPRVYNQPHAGNLSGIRFDPLEDHLLLARAGHPVAPIEAVSNARYLSGTWGIATVFDAEGLGALHGIAFDPYRDALLAGFPALRVLDPSTHPFHSITVVEDVVITAADDVAVTSELAHAAKQIVRTRGLSIASVTYRVVDEGRVAFCAMDPAPALDADAAQAVAQLLSTSALRHAACNGQDLS